MTERRIEDLAAEALQETGANFKNFSICNVEPGLGDTLAITFYWAKPYRVEVSLHLRNNDTEESIKSEIRRQLALATQRVS